MQVPWVLYVYFHVVARLETVVTKGENIIRIWVTVALRLLLTFKLWGVPSPRSVGSLEVE